MPAYRFRDPSPVFFNLLGTGSIPGGYWQFYELGTTTPKGTWADADLTTPNPNPVPLDASGRFTVPVWLDGEYTVVAYDADDNVVVPATPLIPEVAPGLAIPDLSGNGGRFLTTNGTDLIWATLLLLPDPTGSPGYTVVVNSTGDAYDLQAPVEPPEPQELPTIAVTATSFKAAPVGGDDATFLQSGSGTASASGTNTTSVSVTFPTAFNATPTVMAIPTTGAVNGSNWQVVPAITSKNSTGFTVKFETSAGNEGGGTITNNVPFDWFAFGTVDA